jgi:uncharacterized delta-60 repeat protein
MKKLVRAAAGGLLCIHSAGIFAQSTCTAGQLDESFGVANNGYVQISPTLYNYPNSISGESEVLDATGASYSVSTAAADSVGYGVSDIVKVKSGGARDLTFGGFGSVVPPPPPADTQDATLTMDASGNLVIANMAADGASVVLYRYSAAGVPDTTYGTAGVATIPLTQITGPWAIKAAPDGSVLVAAGVFSSSSSSWLPAVFKITPTGALDTTFGSSGFSYFYAGAFGPFGKATDLSIQADGTILVGGRVGDNNTYNEFFVARLLANGALDTSFGTSAGMTVVSFGSVIADGRRMAVEADGKIVLLGGITSAGGSATGVIRLTANGVPDSTFNGTGSVQLAGFLGWQVALQNNNKILISATQPTGPQTNVAVAARLTAAGQLDSSFGNNGTTTLAVPGAANASVAHIGYEPGGAIHILVIGMDVTGTIYTEYLARLDSGTGSGCH